MITDTTEGYEVPADDVLRQLRGEIRDLKWAAREDQETLKRQARAIEWIRSIAGGAELPSEWATPWRERAERAESQLADVTPERDRLQAEARTTRRLRAALRDLLADARERDEELLKLRDRTPDHKKSLGIERAAHEVRVLADSLDRILGVDGADDSQVLVAKADLVAYLNRGTADLATEADALNRLLAAAGLDAGQQDGDGR